MEKINDFLKNLMIAEVCKIYLVPFILNINLKIILNFNINNFQSMNVQQSLIDLLKKRIGKDESIGIVLSELLEMSQDAAYRRYRGETPFSIYELEKISSYFNVSIDDLFNRRLKIVNFDYQLLTDDAFSIELYLSDICDALLQLKNQENAHIILTVNNSPFFQLFNHLELLKFKLFFWAKTHLKLRKFQTKRFSDYNFSKREMALCNEILSLYNGISSTEIYDPDLFSGFAREINYYFSSKELGVSKTALRLYEEMGNQIHHISEQARLGVKFSVGATPPSTQNFQVYFNETLNAVASFYYSTPHSQGLFLAHNFMSSLHTSSKDYVEKTKEVLEEIISNAIKISGENAKMRNLFFDELAQQLQRHQKKLEKK